MRILGIAVLVMVAACRGEPSPVADRQQLAASATVQALKADESPYYIIYSPPVDLAKKATR